MSRTFKDAPWRVQQNRLALTGARGDIRHGCGRNWWGEVVDCDAFRATGRDEHRRCDRMVAGRHMEWDPYYHPAAERSARYYRPERTAVRLALRRAVQEARAGDVDDSLIPVGQHRSAPWGGGWWD